MTTEATRRLLLFSKPPRPDRVKTRLAAEIDDHGRVALYRAFLADQLAFLASLPGARVELWIAGDPGDGDLAGLPLRGVEVASQAGADLGERMRRALERDALPGIVVAADSPTLPRELLEDAFAALARGADAVVGPADDGGYVLIGSGGRGRTPAALFRGMPWGTPGVLERTRGAAARAGLLLHETAGWYDVDEPADLERLRSELASPEGRGRAPRTAALLLDAPGNGVV